MPSQTKRDDRHVVATREPLSPRLVDLLLKVLLRSHDVFLDAKSRLSPMHFQGRNALARTWLWQTLCDLESRFGELPGEDLLLGELQVRINEPAYQSMSDESIDAINEVVDSAYDMEDKWVLEHEKVGRNILARLLDEDLQRKSKELLSRGHLLQLPAVLQQLASEAQSIQAMQHGAIPGPFAEGLERRQPRVLTSTCLDFVDDFLGGGQAAGEVVGFVAPIGVCKTLLVCQLGMLAAVQEQAAAAIVGRRPKIVYLVFWEEPMESVHERILSFQSKVNKDTVAELKLDEMSRRDLGNWKDYERSFFKSQFEAYEAGGCPPAGEYERCQAALELIRPNLRLIDFTGGTAVYGDAPQRMVAGVEEVIRADQRATGSPGVELVMMDYAYVAAKAAMGLAPDSYQVQQAVSGMPDDAKRRIAAAMKTRVWVMQQLTAAKNSIRPGVLPELTDSMGAKAFGMACDVTLVCGTDSDDNMFVFGCRKQRRGQKKPPVIVERLGQFNMLRSTENRYRADAGRIVAAGDFSRLASEDDSAPRKRRVPAETADIFESREAGL